MDVLVSIVSRLQVSNRTELQVVVFFFRSIVSFLGFLVAFGVDMFVLNLHPGTGDSRQTPDDPTTLNLSQLMVFTLAIVWSLVHIRMIHVETRGCMANDGELEAGHELIVGRADD
jgi:hypothetical protein